jgi:hypothetical protein
VVEPEREEGTNINKKAKENRGEQRWKEGEEKE